MTLISVETAAVVGSVSGSLFQVMLQGMSMTDWSLSWWIFLTYLLVGIYTTAYIGTVYIHCMMLHGLCGTLLINFVQ